MGFLNFLSKAKQKGSQTSLSPDTDIPPPPDDFPDFDKMEQSGEISMPSEDEFGQRPSVPLIPEEKESYFGDKKLPEFPKAKDEGEPDISLPPMSPLDDDSAHLSTDEFGIGPEEQKAPVEKVKSHEPELPPFKKTYEAKSQPAQRPLAEPHLFLHKTSAPKPVERPSFLKERDFDISGPLFVQANKYQTVMEDVEFIKNEVNQTEDSCSKIIEMNTTKQEDFKRYGKQLEYLFKKFSQIDESIFQHG